MDNLELMNKRLQFLGGNQEQRMIKDKYRTFLKALQYSYQAVKVEKDGEKYKALINPDKIHNNYDDKILSIDYKAGFKAGDIFKWEGTNSYWIIYLPELTEDAYFRSEIRRCRHQISWLSGEEGKKIKHTYYAYVRGPVETKINFTSKAKTIIDNPNYSLEIYLPFNEDTKEHFKRYQRFAFNNSVWEVQAIDSISTEGIIQIIALENYENRILDDLDKQAECGVPEAERVTDAFYIDPYIENEGNKDIILGNNFIKPLGEFIFELKEGISSDGEWSILEKDYPVILTPQEDGKISVFWNYSKSGSFTLLYKINDEIYQRTIIVESLF